MIGAAHISTAKMNGGGDGSNINKQTTQRRNHVGNQRRAAASPSSGLSLPPWLTCHHLPERGIVSNSTSSSSSNNARYGSKMTSALGVEENDDAADNATSRRPSRRKRGQSSSTVGVSISDETITPLTTASNYKTKKDIALDSIYPPTTQEVQGHSRYLSECAMRIAMHEVEECVNYSLRYSWNENDTVLKDTAVGKDECKTRIDKRMQKWMRGGDTQLPTLASEIHGFFDMFQPDEVDGVDNQQQFDLHNRRLQEDQEDDANNILFNGLRPESYNPNLLPVTVVKCHPNVLDRAMITKGLSSDLSKRSNTTTHGHQQHQPRRSPCVCVIRSTSELVRKGRIVAELLSQCLRNDPIHGESYAIELQKQRKRRKSYRYGGVNNGVLVRSIWSWTQSLIDWAGCTESYDSIIVILEDPEEIASPTLDSFFATMSSLRCGHENDGGDGVPISVVVMDASPGGLGDRLSKLARPAFRGGTAGGAVVRELYVPPPQVQWDLFVNRLFSSDSIPTFLWTDRRLFIDIQADNSIVSVGRMLKSTLRRYFAVPGAFISLLNCEKFTTPNEVRIKWLFGDEHGRRIILSHMSTDTFATINDQEDGNICDLFRRVQTFYLCHQLCQRIDTIFNLSPFTWIVMFSDLHMSSRMLELLRILGHVRRKTMAWDDASTNCTASLQKELDEFIILTSKFASNDEANVALARAIVDHILVWAIHNMSVKLTVDDTPLVQPRRDVAMTLFSTVSHSLDGCPLAHARHVAFGVFQSRVMTLADWYEKYFDTVSESNGGQTQASHSNEAAFFFAVHELVHMGFVKKLSTGKRKEEAYEKIAIIWGNGR